MGSNSGFSNEEKETHSRMVTPPRLLMFRAQRLRLIDWARGNHCLTSVVRKRKGPNGKPVGVVGGVKLGQDGRHGAMPQVPSLRHPKTLHRCLALA